MSDNDHQPGSNPRPPYDTPAKALMGFVILAVLSVLLVLLLIIASYWPDTFEKLKAIVHVTNSDETAIGWHSQRLF